MDRMTSMTAFVKVVDVGGFAAAARKLDMSPSMVTTHVRALEERLGVRLLNRSTRRISLTEVGQAYYERCLQILAEVEDAENVAQALQSTPRGTLRLNASVAIRRTIRLESGVANVRIARSNPSSTRSTMRSVMAMVMEISG